MSQGFLLNPREFKFELVSPEKIEVSGLEERVVLPGEMGDIMILAGHTPLLAGLRPGVVSVIHDNGHVIRYFVSGGFADIGNDHCTILTQESLPITKLVVAALERELTELDQSIAQAGEGPLADELNAKRVILAAKLEAAEKFNQA